MNILMLHYSIYWYILAKLLKEVIGYVIKRYLVLYHGDNVTNKSIPSLLPQKLRRLIKISKKNSN